MSTERQSVKPKSGLSPAGAGLLAVAASLVAIYFFAYVAMGSRSINAFGDFMVYEHAWQEYFFRPAARFESLFREKDIETAHTP
jgi:hypothetical protein